MLIDLDRTLSDARQDDPADALLHKVYGPRVQLVQVDAPSDILQPLAERPVPALRALAQNGLERARHELRVLVEVVHNRVGARVERVRAHGPADGAVDFVDETDGRARDVVHVEDGRPRVQTGGVEAVRVAHRDLRKGREVAVADGGLDGGHPLRHDGLRAGREQGGRRDRGLHALRAGHVFLLRADDQDHGAHLRPVRRRCDLLSDAVAAVREGARPPGDVPAHQGAAGGTGPLACDAAELPWGLGQLVEVRDGAHEGGEAGSGAGQAGSGRKVVLGHDAQREGRELGEGRVGGLELLAEGAQVREAGERALRGLDILRLAIEGEGVACGVGSGAGGGGEGAQGALGQGDGERGVCREVQRSIPLAPVSD